MRSNQAISFPASGFVMSSRPSKSAKPHSRTNQSFLTCIAVSGDEQLLATASLDATLCIWDERSYHLWEDDDAWGTPLKTFYLPSVATAIRFVNSVSSDIQVPDNLTVRRNNSLIISTVDDSFLIVELGNVESMRSISVSRNSAFNFPCYDQKSQEEKKQNDAGIDVPHNKVKTDECSSVITIIGMFPPSEKSRSSFVYYCTSAADFCFHDFDSGKQVCRLSIRNIFEKHRESSRTQEAETGPVDLQLFDVRVNNNSSTQSVEVLFGTFYTQISEEGQKFQENHVMNIEIHDSTCVPLDFHTSILSSPKAFDIDHRLLKVLRGAQCLVPISISEGLSLKNEQFDCKLLSLHYAEICIETKSDKSSLHELIENSKREHGFPKSVLDDSKIPILERRKKRVSSGQDIDQSNKTFELEVARLTEIRNAWLEYIETLC